MDLSQEFVRIGLLKFELLASGVRVSSEAAGYCAVAKAPIRTRSGASGGLDIVLPFEIHVNCPVNESLVLESELVLDAIDGKLVIRRGADVLCSARLQPSPRYYGAYTSDGTPMRKIGQMCSGDRFCYGMTGSYCFLWRPEWRCRFCSIGLNRDADSNRKSTSHLLETLEQAVQDPALPARHILLGGGTTRGEDMGAILASKLCSAIKRRFDLSCYVMICAPLKNEYIDMLHDSGADELALNLEFYSDDAWMHYIPGKHALIGKNRYLEALGHAVSVFGPINTRSLLVVGLEPIETTLQGVDTLAQMGVMPILSPFRPLRGTPLESMRGPDHLTYWQVYCEAQNRLEKWQIPTGPTCIACQNNTLALPLPNGNYRYY